MSIMFYRNSLKLGRKGASIICLLLFSLILLLASAFSEFFQTPKGLNRDLSHYRQLFTLGQLKQLSQLEIINELGVFRFKKGQKWHLTSPRSLLANPKTMANILDALAQIKVLKVYPKDPINMASYALHTPSIKLNLTDAKGRKRTLRVGLVNPVDNSTYLSISDERVLFHVQELKLSLGMLNLLDFIDSTIFSSAPEEVKKISIYRGNKGTYNINFLAENRQGQWYGRYGREIPVKKMDDFLKELLSLKSVLILDKISSKSEEEIERSLAHPLYTIEIHSKQGVVNTYKVGHVASKLADVKMERGQNLLITNSGRKHPYLINKEMGGIFSTNEQRL